jgi:superoxide dismutase
MAFTLPRVALCTDALEPHIDKQTMEIHHGKHHQAYVDNLNKAIAGTEHENKSLEQLVASAGKISPAVRNNGGGHWNHSFFWQILSANGGKPDGKAGRSHQFNLRLIGGIAGESEHSRCYKIRFGLGMANSKRRQAGGILNS